MTAPKAAASPEPVANESAAQPPGLATTGTVNPAATTADAADPIGYWRDDGAFGEFTIPTSGAIPEHGWRPVYLAPPSQAERVALLEGLLRKASERIEHSAIHDIDSSLCEGCQLIERIRAALGEA